MWRGKMSLRKIWSIIRGLPSDSAVGRTVNPEQWRAEHKILADLWDLTLAVNTVPDKRGRKPALKWYPRPGDEERAAEKERAQLEKIRAARVRFRKQLVAGGDFDDG